MQGGGIGTAGMNFFQDHGRCGQAKTAAAKGLRDQDAQVPCLGHGLDKGGRIGPLAVQGAPVFAGKPGAKAANRLADLLSCGLIKVMWGQDGCV
jgi:hypothetical protein